MLRPFRHCKFLQHIFYFILHVQTALPQKYCIGWSGTPWSNSKKKLHCVTIFLLQLSFKLGFVGQNSVWNLISIKSAVTAQLVSLKPIPNPNFPLSAVSDWSQKTNLGFGPGFTEINLNFGLKLDFTVQFRLQSKNEFKTYCTWKDKVTHWTQTHYLVFIRLLRGFSTVLI